MHLKLETHGTTAHLIFDRAGSTANIFDKNVLEELDHLLDTLPKNSSLTALIIHSNKPHIFIAGADLKTLSTASTQELGYLITLGQKVFSKLENLPLTTIAAIHGACVGGGFELALACDYRIASDASSTRIGLPETQLGILPAWGGSTRLPALIGLTKALPLILSGKLLKAKAAQRKKIVDAVCPPERLLTLAQTWTSRPKIKHPLFLLEHNPVAVKIIEKKASESLHKKTRGHYPALHKALQIVCKSVRLPMEESFANEKEAILTLARGPEAKQLMQLFFASEKSKKQRIGEAQPFPLKNTAVIGAGVMGSGIAYWLSTQKKDVLLKEVNGEALAKGMAQIEQLYSHSVKRRILSPTDAQHGLDSITATCREVSLNDRDIIIEAATEDLSLKKKIFSHLSTCAPADTILATNTSALPIHQLIDHVAHPERLVGIHFFNPVPRMKLVEIVRTESTSEATLNSALQFIQRINKLPVVVNDSPGFVVNRILLPYLVRAGELFAEGCDPKLIDAAMLDFGMPMGPIRLLDEIGLDVALHVAKTLSESFPERMSTPDILHTLVEQKAFGKKTARGFYLYHKGKTQVNPHLSLTFSNPLSRMEIQAQLVRLMSEEAARCFDEKVAATAADIDFAMVMGTGYAPFRGGPLRHAQDTQLLNRNFY